MVAASCAPNAVSLPEGDGTPFPDAVSAYDAAAQACRGARTVRATLGLSGRAGATSLRGKVDAGFEAPDRIRLEGRHPLGRPVFILAAADAEATLYFPREERVLRGAPPADIVEALVGLPIGPAELRALVAGCGFGAADPAGGRSYPGEWIVVDTGPATITYLRRLGGAWHIVAAARPPLVVHYDGFAGGRASTLRLRATGSPPSNVTVQLSDVNINIPLDPGVFTVEVPAGTEPLTLEELRRAGPLGER